MPRLNLIWLKNLVFVIIKVESFHWSIMLILLKISLVILKYDLLFHLRIVIILRLKIMLSAIERPSWMNITLVSLIWKWNLLSLIWKRNLWILILVLVNLIGWNMHVDIVDILLLNDVYLFDHLLLLLIHSHLLLNLCLLELLLLLVVLEILLSDSRCSDSRCRLHLWMLLAIIILTKILVIVILVIGHIIHITMIILLWSIDN